METQLMSDFERWGRGGDFLILFESVGKPDKVELL